MYCAAPQIQPKLTSKFEVESSRFGECVRVSGLSGQVKASAVINMAETDQHVFDEAAEELFRQLGLESTTEPSEYDSVNVVFRSKNGSEILVGDQRFAK